MSRPLLVVVHDLDFRRAFRRPNKAHPELIVYPNRVLPFAIARQRLKTVAWRRPQVTEIARGVEVAQFPACRLDQIRREALRTFAVEDGLGALVPEAPDHKRSVSFNDTDVNARLPPGSRPAPLSRPPCHASDGARRCLDRENGGVWRR